MPKEYIQPEELFESRRFGYTQVITSPPGKQVFIAGQTGWNHNLEMVGGDDVGKQAEQAFENLRAALGAAGAKPADVTSLRIYVVDYGPEKMAAIGAPIQKFFEGGPPATQTLIGVQALGMPDILVEIEAQAVVDA